MIDLTKIRHCIKQRTHITPEKLFKELIDKRLKLALTTYYRDLASKIISIDNRIINNDKNLLKTFKKITK